MYQSLPNDYATVRRPAVVVVHENRGLTDYIKDVTRRVAKAGYVAIAVDLLSRQGGTEVFNDPEAAGAAYNRTRTEERREDILSTLVKSRDQPYVQGDRLAALGFCAGGGDVFNVAVNTTNWTPQLCFTGCPRAPINHEPAGPCARDIWRPRPQYPRPCPGVHDSNERTTGRRVL